MNKELLFIGLILAAILLYIRSKKLAASRPQMIDYLNVQLGPNNEWTKLADDELQKVYAMQRQIEMAVEPSPEIKTMVSGIFKKYGLNAFK